MNLSVKDLDYLLKNIPTQAEVFVKVPKGMMAGVLRPSSFVFPVGGILYLRPHESENHKNILYLLPTVEAWEP